MKNPVKTNRLAIVSCASGLTVLALLGFGLYWQAFPASPDSWNTIRTILDFSVSVQILCALVAILAGVFALRGIKKNDGTEKGKTPAWVGIVLGAK